jgi:hypothetical protein
MDRLDSTGDATLNHNFNRINQAISTLEATGGAAGPPGPAGPAGPAGPGVPPGGTVGQILVKTGPGDFEVGWADPA